MFPGGEGAFWHCDSVWVTKEAGLVLVLRRGVLRLVDRTLVSSILLALEQQKQSGYLPIYPDCIRPVTWPVRASGPGHGNWDNALLPGGFMGWDMDVNLVRAVNKFFSL